MSNKSSNQSLNLSSQEIFNRNLNLWKHNWFTKDIELKEKYFESAMILDVYNVVGFLTPGDFLYLWHLGYSMEHGATYLEVGSWMGLSSIAVCFGLMSNLNFTSKVFCVDPWEIMPEMNHFEELVPNGDLYQTFLNNIEKTKVKKFITPLRGKSVDVSKTIEENQKFDYIFIDGDHSFQGCYDDIIAWLPKLKEGGKFIGHDAEPKGEVVQALEQIKKEKNISYSLVSAPYCNYIWELDLRNSS